MKVKAKVATILFILCIFGNISAQNVHPSFEPLFQIKEIDTVDDIFEAALLFSECERNSETWKSCWQKLETIKADMASSSIIDLEEEERGRAILKYLYQNYLKAYSLNQTKIDVALETGFYNCVSSAVLYMVAAKAAELDVRGQSTTQHAFCSIYVTDEKSGKTKRIDVETTNPYGFNPGSKEEIEHENQIKKYYVVPKKYYSNRQEVSDGVFTGLIAGNLCADYIKSGEYKKAVPLGAARWEAVKNEPAKSVTSVRNSFDILAANYVNILPDSAVSFYSTLDWFSSFIDRWGTTDFLQKNLDNSIINLLVLCFQEKNYPLALEAYEKYKAKLSQSQVTKSEEIITDIIIIKATEGLTPEQKVAEINGLLSSEELADFIRQKRAQLHLESYWLEYLNSLMNSRDFELGYAKASIALDQLPKSTKIKAMQNGFYNNSIALIHNNFAKQANAGNLEAARAVLEEGLEKFPNDKTLKRDIADLQKITN